MTYIPTLAPKFINESALYWAGRQRQVWKTKISSCRVTGHCFVVYERCWRHLRKLQRQILIQNILRRNHAFLRSVTGSSAGRGKSILGSNHAVHCNPHLSFNSIIPFQDPQGHTSGPHGRERRGGWILTTLLEEDIGASRHCIAPWSGIRSCRTAFQLTPTRKNKPSATLRRKPRVTNLPNAPLVYEPAHDDTPCDQRSVSRNVHGASVPEHREKTLPILL